jgi:indolepyruvate ferredoxin oxidoreductase alpha subunit
MGNEAIALGALRAGVSVITGYPGTPSSEILETAAKHNSKGAYVEWSVNEKAAMEVAAGASYAGARTMVTMKQVGLNVASDPLMSLNYVGIKGGMVIVCADDPGPISSQTEQDTRHYGEFSKIAVFDPSSPEEAYLMIADAFEFSEKYGRPVVFRPTTRVCHGVAAIEILPDLSVKPPDGFFKDGGKWVIFPKLAYENHLIIERQSEEMSLDLSNYNRNVVTGFGKKGIVSGGVSYAYTLEALRLSAEKNGAIPPHKLFKVSSYPFPEKLALSFLENLDEVLVIEELDPVIENALLRICGKYGIKVKICGKSDKSIPRAGENTVEIASRSIAAFLNIKTNENATRGESPPILPTRAPVLCAGCPHNASFTAVKEAVRRYAQNRKVVYSGDIGCYTLGNTLDMVDTCLCMGAGITVAQGINRVEPDTLNFAFIGDSTFFHTGIPGIINAVYSGSNIIVVILDNSTTAMTGGQPHPGTGKNASGGEAKKIDIFEVLSAIGVTDIVRVNPYDKASADEAVSRMIEKKGVRVILFEAPCIKMKG